MSDGVYVIPDNRVPIVPNVGIVVGTRAVLVVDTGIGPRNGAYVLERARRLADGKPLFLTTTHFHPEHGFGASAFKGVATIIANRAQRDELRRKGVGYVDMFRWLGPSIAAELEGVELVEPDLVYDGDAELDLGGRHVVLRTVGPAHSAGDQTVLVDDRVLFTGDLFETRMFPIAPYFPPHDVDVDPRRWIGVLDELMALGPEVVVPGHGELTDAQGLRAVRDYLDYVRAESERLRTAGTPADEAAAAVAGSAHDRWPTWDNAEMIGLAVHAFYAAG
ncbi:MBL fold metallo-hydrolase [Nonomuraea sp. NPDC050556]|uniref:MBL fold metallo-hydrolase n=1 Tax=Nonomuraea sp. NPDC050556 TaxID=3364369 RepID=UPI0037BD1DD7